MYVIFTEKSAFDKFLENHQPDGLIDHAEQGTEGSQTSEIHDMFEAGSIVQTTFNQTIWNKKIIIYKKRKKERKKQFSN